MIIKKINGCPYKASNNNQCTHKGNHYKRRGKIYCGFEYPHNCPLFLEWIEAKEIDRKLNKNASDGL